MSSMDNSFIKRVKGLIGEVKRPLLGNLSTATNAQIEVYECCVGESPIMRRCKDDWVNATQILKLCNFPKAKRTKILEKGVQQGLHEKVQGGYGRFQGTWIPLPDARRLADEYGITADVVPVLYIDLDDPSVIIPKKSKPPSSFSSANKDGTPVKRKYVKKPKKDNLTPKKMKFDDNLPPQAVFTQDYPPSMANGDAQMHSNRGMQMQQIAMGSQQMQLSHLPATFQQQEFHSTSTNQRTPMEGFPEFTNYQMQMPNYQQQQPQQRIMLLVREESKSYGYGGAIDNMAKQQMMYQQQHLKVGSASTNDTNWSQEEHTRDSDTSVSSTEFKNGKISLEEDNSHPAQLLRFFSEEKAPIPYFLYNPPADFNINEAIDDEGHTALHWAASIGNLNLVHLLLSKGANPLVVSNYGLNPLSKSISFNNCHDLKNFPQIIEALEACLINTDINGRTPLHYLCQFSKVGTKLPALTYYLGIIFNKLVFMTESNKASGVNLMKNVIDHQDVNGDTCLHIAARSRCNEFVKFFLSNGARDDLINVNNETAKSIIIQEDLVVHNFDLSRNGLSASAVQDFQPPQHIPREPSVGARRLDPSQLLGTPIQSASLRRTETPDTQRTTIQDDDEYEDVNDHVSKEQLRTLLEDQAGTVEDNKENIYEDPSKNAIDMSSPSRQQPGGIQGTIRNNILGLIPEREIKTPGKIHFSPAKGYSPNPPQMDEFGHVIELEITGNAEERDAKIPIKDVSSMMNGMVNLLADSYTQELNGLNIEFKRIKGILVEKKDLNATCMERIKALLSKNGFENIELLDEASNVAEQEVKSFGQELQHKEAELTVLIEKAQAFELATLVQDQESQISEEDDISGTLELGIALTREQIKRINLVNKVTNTVKNFAIDAKMNKYRKLISLSCGLRVEDIDGLIDGIEESLMEKTQ